MLKELNVKQYRIVIIKTLKGIFALIYLLVFVLLFIIKVHFCAANARQSIKEANSISL